MTNTCRDLKNQSVRSGSYFQADRCRICLCSNGLSVLCTSKMCATPWIGCNSFIQRADDCCKFDCLDINSQSTPFIKVVSIGGDTIKQGARFGATALTISIIISLFIFMLMRLKRRQALLNSLSQGSGLARQNLLPFSDISSNNLDGLAQLRRMLRRTRNVSGFPSISDFSHFVHITPPTPNRGGMSDLDDNIRISDFSPSTGPAATGTISSNSNIFGLTPPSYEALYVKNEDWPPPYEPPPPYSEINNSEPALETTPGGIESIDGAVAAGSPNRVVDEVSPNGDMSTGFV